MKRRNGEYSETERKIIITFGIIGAIVSRAKKVFETMQKLEDFGEDDNDNTK